jgi:DNA-binding response OmpR family regulator
LLVIASDKVNMPLMTQLIAKRDDLNLMTAVNGMEGMKLADSILPEVVVLDTGLSDICASEV